MPWQVPLLLRLLLLPPLLPPAGAVAAGAAAAAAARAGNSERGRAAEDAAPLLQWGVAGGGGAEVSLEQVEEEVSQHLKAVSRHLHGGDYTEDSALDLGGDAFEDTALDLDEEQPPQLRAFRRFDADGSGGYDRRELAAFLLDAGRAAEEEGIRELWQRADLDGNSEIDYDEFLDCVVSPASCYGIDDVESMSVARLVRTASPAKVDQLRSQEKAAKRMEAMEGRAVAEDGASQLARSNDPLMHLHLMPDKGLNSTVGAVCLDGSDAGFYFAPAAETSNTAKWIIMIEGGGWCGDLVDCLARSHTDHGSSKHFVNATALGGLMSGDCRVNPHFCNFNRVMVAYCDGTSLTSDRAEPIWVKTSSGVKRPLYFRGRRILDAVLDTLFVKHGLNHAEKVLLTGCSAGGLSSLVHADYVHERLDAGAPQLAKFRVVPLSGFFLKHESVENHAAYKEFMYRVVTFGNSTFALNKRCVAAMPTGKKWSCILPENAYAYTEVPVFLVNSAMDWWSGLCVLFAASTPSRLAITRNGACGKSNHLLHYSCGNNVERCTPFEMFAVNQFIRDFSSTLEASPSFAKAGNGAFIHSCHLHCEGMKNVHWTNIRVQNVSMRQAVLLWWRSDGMPSAAHVYRPCQYKQGGPDGSEWPYQCNPTCTDLPGP